MKKFYWSLICVSSITFCYAFDVSSYTTVAPVTQLPVSQPSVVEINNLSRQANYALVDSHGDAVPQQFRVITRSTLVPPESVLGCMSTCSDARTLVDGDESTTFDFPLMSQGTQKGSIKIVYAKPLTTDSVVFRTTSDSYMPNAFTLVIDGKPILNTIEGGSAKFPMMSAKTVEISFTYTQPIRFTEVGVGLVKEEVVTSSVRFVYLPKETYRLYADSPLGREMLPTPPIDLFSKKAEHEVTVLAPSSNGFYKEKDSDGDGVANSLDNCPSVANTNQSDGNTNGAGDACDDYDYDGVMTASDNCPTVVNPDQRDIDKDGVGDACDTEESRLTEKYAWMPWVVFALVFCVIVGMGYEMVQMKKNNA